MGGAYFSPRRTPYMASSIATPTTHQQLSALQAALHGGLPPAMIRTWRSKYDSDSESDDDPAPVQQPYIESRSRSFTPSFTPRPERSSSGSISSSSSEDSDLLHPRETVCTVLDHARTIELIERKGEPPRRFRACDPEVGPGRILSVAPSDDALACIRCRSGALLWSVFAARHARARVLRKHGSPYFVVLGATNWAKHLEKVAYGYLHADPRLKRAPTLAIEVRGDQLGRVFRILGRDGSDTVSLASARRSTKLVSGAAGIAYERSSWSVQIEKNVDVSMITAVVTVLEEWSANPPRPRAGAPK